MTVFIGLEWLYYNRTESHLIFILFIFYKVYEKKFSILILKRIKDSIKTLINFSLQAIR
jgi:hypothetical protein